MITASQVVLRVVMFAGCIEVNERDASLPASDQL